MEAKAAEVLSPWLAQLGVFGLGLAAIGLFVALWLRESRGIRGELGTALARKNSEIEALKEELATATKGKADAENKERQTYAELLACRYPDGQLPRAADDP